MTEETKRSYHHGDLKAALIEVARKQVEELGIEQFSIRACAREIGVHPTAAYRHFKTKESLIGGVAAVGFGELTDQMEKSISQSGNSRERLLASGIAYVTFATQSPKLFRAMFFAAGQVDIKSKVSPNRDRDAYRIFCDCLEDIENDGVVAKGKAIELRPILWATIHGLADLYVLGLMKTSEIKIGDICERFIFQIAK